MHTQNLSLGLSQVTHQLWTGFIVTKIKICQLYPNTEQVCISSYSIPGRVTVINLGQEDMKKWLT